MVSNYHGIGQKKISKKTYIFWKYCKNALSLHRYCSLVMKNSSNGYTYCTSAKHNRDCTKWGYLVLTAGRAGM